MGASKGSRLRPIFMRESGAIAALNKSRTALATWEGTVEHYRAVSRPTFNMVNNNSKWKSLICLLFKHVRQQKCDQQSKFFTN
jgi:hypothetical protein